MDHGDVYIPKPIVLIGYLTKLYLVLVHPFSVFQLEEECDIPHGGPKPKAK